MHVKRANLCEPHGTQLKINWNEVSAHLVCVRVEYAACSLFALDRVNKKKRRIKCNNSFFGFPMNTLFASLCLGNGKMSVLFTHKHTHTRRKTCQNREIKTDNVIL